MVKSKRTRHLVEGIEVPGDGQVDSCTNKVWGSGMAVSVLQTAIESEQHKFDDMMAAPEYNNSDMKRVLDLLGLFHEALGIHLRVQAARLEATGTVRVLARSTTLGMTMLVQDSGVQYPDPQTHG